MEEIITYEGIYAEIKRKRALLGITEKDFSTYKRDKPIKKTYREIIISEGGGCIFKN